MKRFTRWLTTAGGLGGKGKTGGGGARGVAGGPGGPGINGNNGAPGSQGGGAVMLRTWSSTGQIIITNGAVQVSATSPGAAPGGGGGAGGSIVLISSSVSLSNVSLRANGASGSGGGGSGGKIVILSSSVTTNGLNVIQTLPGASGMSAGGAAGGAGGAGGAGAGGFGGTGGDGGLGGVKGLKSVNPNYSTGGRKGTGGAGGKEGTGGKPGDCYWWPCFWYINSFSLWQYWDFGTFPGFGWNLPEYNDSAWRTGTNSFGHGDPHDTTITTSNTCYFRQSFVITNRYEITNMFLFLRRDDGLVVYLNGQEVLRDNMPTNIINHSTPALTGAVDDGRLMVMREIPQFLLLALLRDGTNVLAAEVHQAGGVTNRADMSFQLRLMANGQPGYMQMFPSGWSAFIPQLHRSSNGTPVQQLFAGAPVTPGSILRVHKPWGVQVEVFDEFDLTWQPGSTVILPGESAEFMNPGPAMHIEIVGL